MFGGKSIAVTTAVVLIASCGEIQASELQDQDETATPQAPVIETASGSADAYTPHVVLAVPGSAAYVRPDVVVKLLFSMPMDTEVSTAAFTVVDAAGEPIAGSLQWDVTQMVSAFRPQQELTEGTYQARVDSGACNADGIELGEPFASTFQVYESSGSDKPYAG